MKLLLKLLLSLCVLIIGIYAATPLWLPAILSRQLPPGWQLLELDVAYPGFSEININVLSVKGKLQNVGLTLTAAGIRFSYADAATFFSRMQAAAKSNSDSLALGGKSLPIAELLGSLPELTIRHLQVALNLANSAAPVNFMTEQPLVLDFSTFKLRPDSDNNFHLIGQVGIAAGPDTNYWTSGEFNIDTTANSLRAKIRFPQNSGSSPWLTVAFEQRTHELKIPTRIELEFDADAADKQSLDSLLVLSSGNRLSHIGGKLKIQADFSDNDLQSIERLSLTTQQLLAEFQAGTADFNADFLLGRDGQKVIVSLPRPAKIRYQDKTGEINSLIARSLPGLQRASPSLASIDAVIGAASRLEIQTGNAPSLLFIGSVDVSLSSAKSSVSLQTRDLQVEIKDFSRLESGTAKGLVTLNWLESEPLSYRTDELELKANKLSLSSTGQLKISQQSVDFKQTGDLKIEFDKFQTQFQSGSGEKSALLDLNSARLSIAGLLDFNLLLSAPDIPVNFYFLGPLNASQPVIQVPGDEHSPPMTITIEEMSMDAELSAYNGMLTSTGTSTFAEVRIVPMDASASRVDVSWQELDLQNLAGNLATKTQGFSTLIDGESWMGFDFDITYSLKNNSDLKGAGTLKFDSGTDLPIEFSGNTNADRWNIMLPTTTVKLNQMGDLLRVAHIELPESVKLTDGYIDFQAAIDVDDEITVEMAAKGYELAASMLESNAREASFTFNSHYGSNISANGPLSIESVGLAGGVDVSHVRANLVLENADTFGLKNLYAELFGGQLNINNLRFADNKIDDTMVELSHISLGQLLAYADIDGLQGSGNLQISLPVGSDQSGVYIKNGTFNSVDPGRLAYTQAGVAGSNIGLQALENFHYQDFSGTIDYQAGGAYQISIHLEGKNPDLYDGYPIVVNLNIGGILPELFEAMFLTGSFEESILEQIKAN